MISSERTVSDSSSLTGWYKSSYSDGNQAECLEVARGHAHVPVRDSKTVPGPALLFSTNGWATFVTAVKEDRLAHGQQ
ncbi:DUF397 domain-containing protein [Streptomyces lavenduligriseus]|uniref:DUF397 domain-containing protein n=1 Tax=Streptomyces lavenduligriseus TaxID=67315 RepID=A0ABT0NY89_9ACTN|nr:DUF397 domain-containing protein [Streptomyces lavenduligriseus]MCL3996453.1 DUF397 domain-containing protein [Streptomyces lavenduligriseus]